MLRYSPKTSPRDAISTMSYIVCLGTVDCMVAQVLQNPGLWKSFASTMKAASDIHLDTYLQFSMLRFALSKPRLNEPYVLLCISGFLGALALFTTLLSWKKLSKPVENIDETGNRRIYQDLRVLKAQHETASILSDLVDKDGAGAWPPKANHDSWPAALQPYKDIYLECVPLLPAAEPSTDDDINQERRGKYRSLMRKLLQERINVTEVQNLMTAVEAGDWSACPRDAYNGFYCCVAVCRHAYRWGTIPVVKVAQLEKTVDFPESLNVPWPYLQQSFGVEADSGNNTANVLHNFNEKGERVYKINVGMSDVITSSEETFFRMFYDLEVLAFPIYYDMVQSGICFERGDKETCLQHLESMTFRVRHLLMVFYQNLTESKVSHSVWLSYVQGFQGWGVGRMIDGEFVKFDGLSGNHVLFFQALDAFLGMDRYLTDLNMDRYIPANQRDLCLSLKKNCFRNKLDETADSAIAEEIKKIVNHLKVFRAAHRARVMPYLEQPAPERLTMTAGKSVLETPSTKDIKEALKVLDDMLVVRLKQTV
ncbi:uncharacterized protein KY384_000298 [Bacidia gigantensis]|uniref:uncharacterized protein n=1 Tax=Bacidia gigantensis TaxID=2732470 RepID=UPI001D0442AF|nr:uncharacterized protein KY384_000298 [Bacidia gigantensis]KAG8526305.1 hypothetical protein KY384_000298 [Bacidia gigantensis]